MTSKKPENYRIRIDRERSKTYIVRRDGKVWYMSGDETVLALSNLVIDDAAALRFALEDAKDGAEAAKAVRTTLANQWKNNMAMMPQVVLL
jgi:hypothetical protein